MHIRERHRRPVLRLAAVIGATAILAGGFAAPVAAVESDRPIVLGLTHYTGELHSHTGLTHEDEQTGREWSPTEVFQYLEDEGQLDFFAATEKAHRMDITNADEFIDDVADAESEEWRELFRETGDWNGGDHDLVAVPGQEVSWANLAEGHVNVFNAEWLLGAEPTGSGWTDGTPGEIQWDLAAFYARLKQDPDAIAQFNHPVADGYGTFYDFANLDRQLDEQFELFEYKQEDDEYERSWWTALDAGWHVAPTWSGDDHGRGFNDNPARSGIWAESQTTGGLYDAMHRRSIYATFDGNATLAVRGNGEMMGSLLPASTSTVDLEIALTDPDAPDASGTATVYSNGGEIVATLPYTGAETTLKTSVSSEDGDWFYAKIVQSDGDHLISAPIWVGETVRGADYSPVLTISELPATVRAGQRVELPRATAIDDSGETPTISMQVFTGEGLVPVVDGGFTVDGFDDQVIVIKAKDAAGNVGSELRRLTVSQEDADPDLAFRHFDPTVGVGAVPGTATISAVTDQRIEAAWAQVLPADSRDWSKAVTVESTGRKAFDIDTAGRPSADGDWFKMVTGQVLRNHEFPLADLRQGERYQYRFALSPDGPWTTVRGEFRSGGFENDPIYILGDLQVEGLTPPDPADAAAIAQLRAQYELFPETLKTLEDEHPGGDLLIQVGDLVNDGSRRHQWDQVFDWALDDLDLEYAGLVGNHETQGEFEHNTLLSPETNSVFSGIFANPRNGAIGESNYSFDRGDIHFSVINSMYSIDEQLEWLIDDMRATDKKWKVVLGHFSYFGGEHASDARLVTDRAKIAPVIEQLGVDLYIGGHDHVYKRSVLLDGALAQTPEEELLATAWVTMGSSGPKFYDNTAYEWDDIVFDENTQTGMVLEATDEGLRFDAYTVDGRKIDEYLIRQPEGVWDITSADIRGGKLEGIGVTSYPGSRTEPVTVTVGVYDYLQETLLETRSVQITLNQRGGEQLARFAEPLTIDPRNTIRAFTWDSLGNGEPLKPPVTVREGMLGVGSAEDPYQLRSANDLERVANDLSANYVLMNDIAFDSVERATIAPEGSPFTGVFDGQGHVITGLVNSTSNAVALFGENAGTIRDLGIADAQVHADARVGGILVGSNSGVVERVWTTGAVTNRAQVGGIVGYSSGVVRDSWSTASVQAQTRVGGIVGSAADGSVTERNWFGGAVTMTGGDGPQNGGGVVGFMEPGSRATANVVLDARVTGKFGQGVTGQVQAPATLRDNLVSTSVVIMGQQRPGEARHDTLKGEPTDPAVLAEQSVYADRLGWDFDSVWRLDPATGRPGLISEKG